MNLKGFKKVKEDDHKALFRNKDGHTITVAKAGLSKGHLNELKKLPLHAYEGADTEWYGETPEFLENFEGAGPYSSKSMEDTAARDKVRGAKEANDDAIKSAFVDERGWKRASQKEEAPPPQMPPAEMSNPSDVSLAPQEELPSLEDQQAPMQQAPQMAQQQPQRSVAQAPAQSGFQQQYQKSYNDYVNQHASEMGQEAAMTAQDLNNGHITPKTYRDLFASKDTLGKIGTLFGLMISGAGSGLSGQPNAVLSLMNKEIENDFNAQVKSKDNALVRYQQRQQDKLNKATLGMNAAQVKNLQADTALKTTTNYKNMLLLSALHDMQTSVYKMPPGQQQQVAQASVGQIGQEVGKQIQQNNLKTAQAIANKEMAFQEGQKKLKMAGMLGLEGADSMAKYNEEHHVPGVGDSSIAVPENVRSELIAHQKLEDAAKDLFDFTKKHTTVVPGTPLYNVGEEKAETLRQMIREGMLGTVFRESEKPLLEKFVPKNPGGFLKVIQSQPKIKALLDSNIMQGNALREHYGLPKHETKQPEENVITTKSGRQAVMRNGKLVYK